MTIEEHDRLLGDCESAFYDGPATEGNFPDARVLIASKRGKAREVFRDVTSIVIETRPGGERVVVIR